MSYYKKIVAVICAVALVIAGAAYVPTGVKAKDFSQLTYKDIRDNNNTEFDQKLKGAQYAVYDDSRNISIFQFQNVAFSELYIADGGWSADQLKATVNGTSVTVEGAGIRIINAATVLTKRYNEVSLTWSGGECLIIVFCPAIEDEGEETGESTSTPESQVPSGETTKAVDPTSSVVTTSPSESTTIPDASSLPKKAQGLNPQVKTDQYNIDNAVLLAWASVMEPTNPEYDPSVFTYNLYIYKDGSQVTKVCNVFNGCILGGLSSGTYGFAVAAVNAMGEGPKSDTVNATITGGTLNYTPKTEYTGPKIPDGFAITSADPTYQSTVPAEQRRNTLQVAWAASNANPLSPGYDTSVTGYNVYVFKADTGQQYRRVHVDGIGSNTAILKNVSAGRYVCFVTAVNANGESGMAAPGLSLPSSVEIEGDVIDNAQDFDYPDQPDLPLGLVINELEAAAGGFSIAWSPEADLTGQRINVFVNGVCVKCGANDSADPTYHEKRLKPGTYEIAVTSQFTSNNVESFPLTKTIVVGGDGTNTPEQIADPSYSGYVPPQTDPATQATSEVTEAPSDVTQAPTDATQAPTDETNTTKASESTVAPVDTTAAPVETTKAPVVTTKATTKKPSAKVTVGKTKVKKFTKKKSAKKAKVKLKKVAGASGYQIRYGIGKKLKKAKTKNVFKLKFTLKKLKKNKKYYIKARAFKNVGTSKIFGAWSKLKKVKFKK
ncbi:MAG: hypothetical protein J6W35_03635 [Eubacterium sp.]|nr:hypothetical protein [Eubacterium sp.]